MSTNIRHTTLLVLLASYMFVGVAAHCEAFSYIFGLESDPVTLTESKPAHPAGMKVAWNQQKHIPVITKVSISSAAIFTFLEFPRVQQYSLLLIVLDGPNPRQVNLSARVPRGPPFA